MVHQDFIDGYRDGYDRSAPEPSANRSARYQHSFRVGRSEILGQYMSAAEIKQSLEAAELADADRSLT